MISDYINKFINVFLSISQKKYYKTDFCLSDYLRKLNQSQDLPTSFFCSTYHFVTLAQLTSYSTHGIMKLYENQELLCLKFSDCYLANSNLIKTTHQLRNFDLIFRAQLVQIKSNGKEFGVGKGFTWGFSFVYLFVFNFPDF